MSASQMTKNQKDLLKPHADHFSAMAQYVATRTDDDMKLLLEACDATSQMNCGWDTYAAAQYLAKEARIVISQRERRAAETSA
jgi:hypothetical protein